MLKIKDEIDLKKFAEDNKFEYCRKTNTYPRRCHRSFEGKSWNFMQIYIDTREIHTGSIDNDGASDFLYDLIKNGIIIKENIDRQLEIVNDERRNFYVVGGETNETN